jgi:hypothetical protein
MICFFSAFILIACSSSDENETEEPVEATATVVAEEATPEVILDRDAACPPQVISAMTDVDTICSDAGGNQVCYGNVRLAAVAQSDAEAFNFDAPGDIVNLNQVQSLSLSSDLVQDEWGVALMRLQANISDSLPGQYLTFVLFGNAQIAPNVNVAEGELQSFYFSSGIGDSPCAEAPDSGILVQTPEGVTSVQFLINNVDITLGSTAYLQAEDGQTMTISVLEGEAAVTSFSERTTVPAGLQTVIELDDEGQAAGPPSDPKPYNGAQFVKLPIANLQRPVRIANSMATGEFTAGTENWQTAHGASAIIFSPADDTTNGAICADDGTGEESAIRVSMPAIPVTCCSASHCSSRREPRKLLGRLASSRTTNPRTKIRRDSMSCSLMP